MSDEKNEVVKEVVKEESLKEKLGETVDLLKKKIQALNEKNKELMAKCIEQGIELKARAMKASEKPIAASKSFYHKLKVLFERPEPLPKILVLAIGSDYVTYRGKIIENKSGFLRLKEAEIIGHNGVASEIVSSSKVGHVSICRDNVLYIADAK